MKEDSDATLVFSAEPGDEVTARNDSCLDEALPFLVISNGFEKGRKILVMSSDSVIGRSLDCPVCIKDNRVSSQHARLICECSQVTIQDMGSKNGTFVNGRKRAESTLNDGDRIMVGSTELVITIPEKSS